MTKTSMQTTTVATDDGLATPERRDRFIIALAKSGATYEDIGTKVNLSRERVRQILSSHGIARKADIESVHQQIKALASLNTMTVSEIAAATKKPEDYIDHFCRQNRLRVPRQRKTTTDGASFIRTKPADLIPEVRQLAGSGMSTAQIAVQLKQPYHAIYSLRRRNGV